MADAAGNVTTSAAGEQRRHEHRQDTHTGGPGHDGAPSGRSTALLTDHYELTIVDAALTSGVAHHRCVFEVFARSLPPGRRYGVVAGTGRLVDAIARFRFDDADLAYLADRGFLRPATLDWLADYRFRGDISGYREGELYFPGSPVLTVDGSFAEAVLLETLVLSVLNHDSAVASAAARMVHAANGRALIEAGGRRTHEVAAVAAARAAYLVGFSSTSNLEAGRSFAVPTGGTASHALVLAHPSEAHAFAAQLAQTGPATTLLVDTYDIQAGIRTAVATAGPSLGAIRIDSGDVASEARRARLLLDELGADTTRIVVSGDLDEYAIAALEDAPVDAMLVGTEVVTGSGAPTAKFVYKLVAIADGAGSAAPMRDVAKLSIGKQTLGGRKVAVRWLGPEGFAVAEHVSRSPLAGEGQATAASVEAPGGPRGARRLQVPFVVGGDAYDVVSLEESRAHHRLARAELRPPDLALSPGPPALVASLVE